jgi:hypothetical protein
VEASSSYVARHAARQTSSTPPHAHASNGSAPSNGSAAASYHGHSQHSQPDTFNGSTGSSTTGAHTTGTNRNNRLEEIMNRLQSVTDRLHDVEGLLNNMQTGTTD